MYLLSFCFFHSGSITNARLIWIVVDQPVSKPNLLDEKKWIVEKYVKNMVTAIHHWLINYCISSHVEHGILTQGLCVLCLQSSVSPSSRVGLTYLLRYSSVASLEGKGSITAAEKKHVGCISVRNISIWTTVSVVLCIAYSLGTWIWSPFQPQEMTRCHGVRFCVQKCHIWLSGCEDRGGGGYITFRCTSLRCYCECKLLPLYII